MKAAAETIKTMYETLDMSVEEICTDLGEDGVLIKTVLSAHSSKYRDDVTKRAQLENAALVGVESSGVSKEVATAKPVDVLAKKFGFTDEEAAKVKETLFELATNGQVNDAVRLSASKYIWDDYHGRLDSKKDGQAQLHNNIIILQDRLLNGAKILAKSKGMKSGEALNV